jgi:Domain of unknown function (DUF4383)
VPLARLFCLAVGPALVVGGIVGLAFGSSDLATGDDLPTHDFGPLFAFNGWHHVLHLATGVLLLAGLLRRSWALPVTVAFGALYAVLTPLAVIDGDDVLNVFYSDMPDNFIHLTLAVAGLGLGLWAAARAKSSASSSTGPSRSSTRSSA